MERNSESIFNFKDLDGVFGRRELLRFLELMSLVLNMFWPHLLKMFNKKLQEISKCKCILGKSEST